MAFLFAVHCHLVTFSDHPSVMAQFCTLKTLKNVKLICFATREPEFGVELWDANFEPRILGRIPEIQPQEIHCPNNSQQ